MENKINFEEGIAELEEIVAKLESGEATLDQSFTEYERGVKLYRTLKQILSEGEARIIELTKANSDEPEDKENADA